jgi:hypothetical protein
MKYRSQKVLFLSFIAIKNISFADANKPSNVDQPVKMVERYCEPKVNSATLAEIKTYSDQLNKTDKNDEKEMNVKPHDQKRKELMSKLVESSKKLKCTYRIMQP